MIFENLKSVQSRIRAAAERAGRSPDEVGLVAVTKYAGLDAMAELLACGLIREIGESRVQAAQAKKAALGAEASGVRWRMIGRLQQNKARRACEIFDCIDSLDKESLAAALDGVLAPEDRLLPVLVQVKLAESPTQGGVRPEDLDDFLKRLKAFPRLDVSGLMAIAPNLEPVEEVRPFFRKTKILFDRFFSGRPGAQLSMGMSRDFEIAVEEGSTRVRVGSTIFVPSASVGKGREYQTTSEGDS